MQDGSDKRKEAELSIGASDDFYDASSFEDVIIAKLGRAAHLPCQCGRWNVGVNNPPKWKNSCGEDVLLTGPEVDTVPCNQSKYLINNDMKWLKVRGDCSLILRNVIWEDQGEYTCTYLEPLFKFVPFQNYWIEGYITCKVVLMIKDLNPIEGFTVAEGVQERFTTVTTLRVNSAQMKLPTLALEITKSVNTLTQAATLATTLKGMNDTTAMVTTSPFGTSGNFTSEVVTRATFANKTVTTSLMPMKFVNVTQTPDMIFFKVKEVVNVTQEPMLKIELSVDSSNEIFETREQMVEENDADSSLTDQRTVSDVEDEFFDFD
ncbi:hypothetical protein ABVT39_008198 [Epinephelus coioides]